jgi:transposase InsO family protein
MKEIHKESEEIYGAERIHRKLLERGFLCGVKLVEKLMRIAQISSKIKAKFKPSTTDSNHEKKISPNILNRTFKTDAFGKVWISDISYIKVGNHWMYLCVIIDLFNREVIGWSFDENMETSLLIKAFKNAVNNCKPLKECIFHSDRGVQYASDEFRSILEKYNMKQSMSRKGNCWDNAVAESFFKTIKAERVYHVKYQTKDEARSNLFQYIEVFYNRKRIHSFLNFTSPVDFRKQYKKRVA